MESTLQHCVSMPDRGQVAPSMSSQAGRLPGQLLGTGGQAVNMPSHVTPWLSVDEQLVPEQETAGP
ncbi:hypothetical protein BHS04_11565 [Myxococcus xanthus]|nr:hypothetical protein BHS04_11565 [Myxococcus xanthus]